MITKLFIHLKNSIKQWWKDHVVDWYPKEWDDEEF